MPAPITTFSGLASGIDTAALIKASVQVALGPINRLQAKKTSYSQQSKKLTDIKTKLTTLQTAAKALDSRSEVLLNKATSSNEQVFKVSSTAGATVGTFSVEVTSVAQSERTYSDAFTASNQTGLFGLGQMAIQVGDGTISYVDVDAGDTLESVVGKINSAGVGVTAGLISTGPSAYRLQVSGNATGVSSAVTFTESSGLNLGLSKAENEVQAATDTVVKMDNMIVSSGSSAVSGMIPGVTLDVVAEGTATVKVERDPGALETTLDTFVTAYNDIRDAMNDEAAYTGVAKGPNSLSGDSTLRTIQAQLGTLVTQGVSDLGGAYTTLASIGLSVQRDGTLSLDADKLKTATSADYEGVTRLLSNDTGTLGIMGQIRDALTPFASTDGSLSSRINSMSKSMASIDDQIANTQLRIDKYEENLRRQFASLESLIGGLNSQGQALTSMINSFKSNSNT